MDPLTVLGACSSILQIIDFSCKVLSKGNQLRTSLSGSLPENVQLERVITHLHGLVDQLQRQPAGQGRLEEMTSSCTDTANELLAVLERLKIQDNNGTWKSWRQAIKSIWKKEHIEGLLARLQLIRDEIEFGVLFELREQFCTLSAQQGTRFNALDRSTKAILQAVISGQSASAAAANAQLRAVNSMNSRLETLLIKEHQQTRDEILGELRQRNLQTSARWDTLFDMPYIDPSQFADEKTDILVMLKFVAIDDRHSAIPEAHRRTFEWIRNSQSRQRRMESNFWQWLTAGQGIYWISGKAGSGKSTLMKYIYHDPRMKQGLEAWSEGMEVVTAGFFFWNSGSTMQKSLLGLLQSILYEILQQKEDLKEMVFPQDVQDDLAERWKVRAPDIDTVWTLVDLKAAFQRLLQIPCLKIFLLVDGLDEYEGENDDIANMFSGIITSPSVKACLSSRLLVTFQHAFSSCPHLRLQDLTYTDIDLYVRETLNDRHQVLQMSRAEPENFQTLIEEIITKASGVFLWVTFAVRTLLEGLTNYDRMTDLQHRLSELPDDLSDLYLHMLRSIKPAFYMGQAAKLLSIVHSASKEGISLRIQELAVADEYQPGQDIGTIQLIALFEFLTSQASITEGRLMSRCRGLLEVQQYGVVSFLHQSVLDFLAKPDVKDILDQHIQKPFSPYCSIIAASLFFIKNSPNDAALWSIPIEQQGILRRYRNEGDILHWSLRHQEEMNRLFQLARRAEESGRMDASLLDNMNKIYTARMKTDMSVSRDMWVKTPWRGLLYTQSGWSWHRHNSWAGIPAHHGYPRPRAWNDTFISLCLQRGLTKYVAHKLDTGEPMNQGPQRRPLLDFVIDIKCVLYWKNEIKDPSKLLELCEMLFERGANPNEVFLGKSVWERLHDHAKGRFPFGDAMLHFRDYAGHRPLAPELKSWTFNRFHDHWIWIDLMDSFLQHGADPTTGLTKSMPGGYDEVVPVALFIREVLMLVARKKAQKLYDQVISLGGSTKAYRRPSRPMTAVLGQLMWELSGPPKPKEIPILRSPTAARLATRPYPENQGLIPCWTEEEEKKKSRSSQIFNFMKRRKRPK